MSKLSAHCQHEQSMPDRIREHMRRAGGDVVESAEVRAAFGAKGVQVLSRLAQEGEWEKLSTGRYRNWLVPGA